MGVGFKITLLIAFLAIVTIVVLKSYQALLIPKDIPTLVPKWWGSGKQPAKLDTSIRPFKINVSDNDLQDLRHRLDNTRLPPAPLEGIEFQYGFNSETLKKVLKFWQTEYIWRDRETYLNQYPQFKTKIQGLDIHFIHVKPEKKSANIKSLPILLLHGWPGSVREFYSLIPMLTGKDEAAFNGFTFEVIAPSLPGYGWSEAATKPGMGPGQIAFIFKELMERLGHKRWYVHGGDWGSVIGGAMATLYPQQMSGLHSTMCIGMAPFSIIKTLLGSVFPSAIVDAKHQDRMYPLSKIYSFLIEESGYMHIQATKPDTVGTALTDSPAGLAAYILEKFSTWTNPNWKTLPDGGLTKKFTYTDLLDNIMIYWVTGSITSSMRLYAENFNSKYKALNIEAIPTEVPTACAKFKYEIFYQSDSLIRDKYPNLIQSTDIEDGGHFASFEVPNLVAEDVWKAVRKMETKPTKKPST